MANGIKLGNLDISAFKVGSADCKVYLGDTLLYPTSRLPEGYTEVEYIENQTLAYIDTGFKPNQDTRILIEAQNVTSTQHGCYVGSGSWERPNAMRFDFENNATGTLHIHWGTSNGWDVYNNVIGDYNKHEYDWDKNYFYIDKGTPNEFSATTTYGNFQCTDNLGVLNIIEAGQSIQVDGSIRGKLFSFKMWDNGTLIRDLVPCIDPNNIVGCYDIVNGVFYPSANRGSGYDFTAPPTPKWVATYTGGSVSSAECDASSAITRNEITLTDLLSVEIGYCVETIEQASFASCNSLTSCTIGDGVTSIGTYAFYGCSGMTSCSIGSGVTSIGGSAFQNCSSLTSIVIPDSVTTLDSAFQGCRGLTSCTIGSGVTSIGTGAFNGCSSLTSIVIPDSVTSIGTNAFVGCSGMTFLTCLATTPPSLGQMPFDFSSSYPLYVPAESINAYKSAWSDYSSRLEAIPNS